MLYLKLVCCFLILYWNIWIFIAWCFVWLWNLAEVDIVLVDLFRLTCYAVPDLLAFLWYSSGNYEVPQWLSLFTTNCAFPIKNVASQCIWGNPVHFYSHNHFWLTTYQSSFVVFTFFAEWRGLHIHPASTCWWSSKWRVAFWALEPHTKCQVRPFDSAVRRNLGDFASIGSIEFDLSVVHCRTILLSIISLLNEPNTSSPANVDASVMFRRWRESKFKDKEYETIIRSVILGLLLEFISLPHVCCSSWIMLWFCLWWKLVCSQFTCPVLGLLGSLPFISLLCVFVNRKQVSLTKKEAERDGVTVPTTLQEYCVMSAPRPSSHSVDMADFYDDDYMDEDDDLDDDDNLCYDDEDDSGHGDSWWSLPPPLLSLIVASVSLFLSMYSRVCYANSFWNNSSWTVSAAGRLLVARTELASSPFIVTHTSFFHPPGSKKKQDLWCPSRITSNLIPLCWNFVVAWTCTFFFFFLHSKCWFLSVLFVGLNF